MGRKKKRAVQKMSTAEQVRIEKIWRNNYKLLCYIARQRNIPESDCEDLAQNCISNLSNQKVALSVMTDDEVKIYLLAAIENECKTWFLKQLRQQQIAEKVASRSPITENSPEADIITKLDSKQQVSEIMEKLSEQERNLMIRKYYLEMTDEDIAASVGCQPQSVRSLVSRARKKMLSIALKPGTEGFE